MQIMQFQEFWYFLGYDWEDIFWLLCNTQLEIIGTFLQNEYYK